MSFESCCRDIKQVEDIIKELKLEQDELVQKQMALVHITLDASKIHRIDKSLRELELLSEISEVKINHQLYEILRNALGYYAIVEQVDGTNEPPIGPMFAQQLLDKIDKEALEICFVRDELYQILAKTIST